MLAMSSSGSEEMVAGRCSSGGALLIRSEGQFDARVVQIGNLAEGGTRR